METKKILYNDILIISKEIKLLLQLGNLEKIAELLSQRENLLEKIKKEDFKIAEIKKIIGQIKELDENNFKKMENFKTEISQKIFKLSKNKKLIGSYKQNEIYSPRLVDEINS